MIATKYEYVITSSGCGGFNIELWEKATYKTKYFYIKSGNIDDICNHMESLTDTICADFMKK